MKFLIILFSLTFSGTSLIGAQQDSSSQPVPFNWQKGPLTADLGGDLAQVELDSNYAFLGKTETIQLMQMLGNTSNDNEMGLVVSRKDGLNWFLLFEYDNVGYIKDDDKKNLDAKAILKSISDGTEAANARRKEMGAQELHVIGWYKEPWYNEETNNIVWAITAYSGTDTIVNYNTRILGRGGYTSVVLVASLDQLDSIMAPVEVVLNNFSYKTGSKYAEWVKGDKVAEYGLAALIAGGAGFAAVKLGFFGMLVKFWKAIAVGVVAFFAALKNKIMRLFGLGKKDEVRKIE